MMSLRRFTVLYLLSFGLYLYYWHYKTLKGLKLSEGLDISPGWRTAGLFVPLLNIYLLYDLFRRVDEVGARSGHIYLRSAWWRRPGWLTAWYFLWPFALSQLLGQAFMSLGEYFMTNPAIIWVLMPAATLISLLPCVWVLSMVQDKMNCFLMDFAPSLQWNHGLSTGQVGIVVGGMALFASQVAVWYLVLLWLAGFVASLP